TLLVLFVSHLRPRHRHSFPTRRSSDLAMLEAATGVRAFSVGKPSPVMMRAARKEMGLATDETAIIGDTMETDILGGVQLGYHTVLVLSGGTAPNDLARYAYRPDVVVASLAEFAELLEESDWQPPWRMPNVGVALQEDGEDQSSRLAAYSAAYRTFPPTIV